MNKKYLLDVYTERNEVMVSKLIREPEASTDDEIQRVEWQISNSDTDILLSDMVAIAIYTKSMEDIDKYEDGIAFYSGDELLDKVFKLMAISEGSNHRFVGWNLKTFVVPVLYRAFLLGGLNIKLLDSIFDLYPFDNLKTVDLSNLYNFNGQMITVRSRNRYSLEETAYAYGAIDALDNLEETNPEIILRKRIKLQKYLYELRGLEWQ